METIKRVTISDIARLSGVSVSTVSKAINGNYKDISQETREKVMEVVKKYNYSPNKLARAIARRQTDNIGLVIPNIGNPFFGEVAKGVADYAYSMGMNTILCNSDDDINRENKHLFSISKGMVDGIILTPVEGRTTGFKHIVPDSIPMVLLGTSSPTIGEKYIVVRTNSEYGAFCAVEHLILLGHKHILYVGGSENSAISRYRFNGYIAAHKKYGLKVDYIKNYHGTLHSEWGEKAINDAISKGIKFTAAFCANDLIAYGVMSALKLNNLQIPEDVSIIGFDDLNLSSENIGLTSVSQPKCKLGKESAKALITLIQGGVAEDVLIEPVLVHRSTVCKIN